MNEPVLGYPLHPQDQRVIRDFLKKELPDLMIDSVWDDFFYRYLLFESLDGWNKIQTTPANIALVGPFAGDGGYYVKIATDATNNDFSMLYKMHFTSASGVTLSFAKPSRFRCEFQVNSVAALDAAIYHGRSVSLGESNGEIYGFEIANAVLTGTSASMISGSLVGVNTPTLATLSAGTDYLLEARHFPGDKVVFYVNGDEKGAITNKSAIPFEAHNGLCEFYMETNEGVSKSLFINYFDLIQKK